MNKKHIVVGRPEPTTLCGAEFDTEGLRDVIGTDHVPHYREYCCEECLAEYDELTKQNA